MSLCLFFLSSAKVVRLGIGNSIAGHLYSRLVPLVLLLIDGNFFISQVTSQFLQFFVLLKVQGFSSKEKGGKKSNFKVMMHSASLRSGSNPIDVTDPGWELYLLIQQGPPCRLLGFSAVYRFYRYPDSSRLRLSQV